MISASDLHALLLTLKVATIATFISLVLGVILAWLLAHYRFWGHHFFDALLTLPMVMPPTVLGYYLLVLFGQQGVLGAWMLKYLNIKLVFTWQAAVIAATVASFPLVFKSARAAFEEVQGNLENSARVLGSNELEIFIRISFPLAVRGIIAGTLLAFARSMGEFGATIMIAGNLPGRTQTLSMAVYDAVQAGEQSRADILVLLISVVCIVILTVSGHLLTPTKR